MPMARFAFSRQMRSSNIGENLMRTPTTKAGKQRKVHRVLTEFKQGVLHSGSASGPKVTNRKQAIAIGLSEAGLSRKKK
jgi:hypothetical protein